MNANRPVEAGHGETKMTTLFINSNGTETRYNNADAAMKAHAADNFKGTILAGDKLEAHDSKKAKAARAAEANQDLDFGDDDPKAEAVNEHLSVTGAEAEVSDIAAERIARHEKSLLDLGIVLPPPLFAPGTRINSWGHDNFRTSRQEWEKSPEIVSGLRDLYRTIKAEKRQDHTVAAKNIRMFDDGTIDFGIGKVGVEAQGLKSLCSRNPDAFPFAGKYLAAIDPELRAHNFNKRLAHVDPEHKITLRIRRNPKGGYSQFATVSPTYASVDADEIAVVLGNVLKNSGMRGEIIYDPATTNLKVTGTYHADKVVDFAAGDVFKVGYEFRSNDAAGGSIKGFGTAWRNLCLNLVIIGVGRAPLFSLQHRGERDLLIAKLTEKVEASQGFFDDFASEWGTLRNTKATDLFDTETVMEALAAIATMREFDVGLKSSKVAELLAETWKMEPGDTAADVMNAITRVHSLEAIDNARRARFEEAAGLLVPVLARRAAKIGALKRPTAQA